MRKATVYLAGIAKAVAAVVVAVPVVYGAIAFIDDRIDKKLTDEATLRRVAKMVRPSCIFDDGGRVLFDSGAMNSIESIEISHFEPAGQGKRGNPKQVTIVLREHTAYPPLITCLDAVQADLVPERGPKFSWVYSIHYGFGRDGIDTFRFRLELLQ